MSEAAYRKAQQLGLTGTDAEQAAILSAITNRSIPIAFVELKFDEWNLAEPDPILNQWVGSLVTLHEAPGTPAELKAGLGAIFVHLNRKRSVEIDTTNPVIARETAALIAALQSLTLITASQVAEWYAAGGGLVFPGGVTAADIAAGRLAVQRQDDVQEMLGLIGEFQSLLSNAVIASDPVMTPDAVAATFLTQWAAARLTTGV